MSAADERIAELLDRWLKSVELHAGYLKLDDAAYAKAQDWPRHQRPTKWVVDLAHARLLDLKRQLADRQARGDAGFAESLELMSFLTTLLGSEHIERFIPLARETPATVASEVPDPAPTVAQALHRKAAPSPASKRAPAPAPAAAEAPRPRAAARAPRRAAPPAETKPEIPDALAATVIADAVRFLGWGREWPQLASLIARLADRPSEQEIWKILRKHRGAIEAQAKRPPD
jgi:hypothetical protein